MSLDVHVDLDTETFQDVIDRLGGVPASRILLRPAPGEATEADAVRVRERKRVLCELVDGVLVEKGMGYVESLIAGAIYAMIREFVRSRKLGVVSVADGPYRLAPGSVLVPDVAFASWDRFPGGRVPDQPIADLTPDLAVEVISTSNTAAEMHRKRDTYFAAGTLSVWLVDPRKRTIAIHDRDTDESRLYGESDVIQLQRILPGFQISLAELFGELDEIHGGPASS